MIDPQGYLELNEKAGQIFNPNTPVSEKDLFSGRIVQIERVLNVVFQRGQHVIIFGERGVGKTSLANVLSEFAPNDQVGVFAIRVNCDRNDTFKSVWMKVFSEIAVVSTRQSAGYKSYSIEKPISGVHYIPADNVTPHDVKVGLQQLGTKTLPVVVIDEFDRLPEEERKIFADLIKSLSDYASPATIILIGVGESVEQIIQEHHSVSRALVQVQMPRMSIAEIEHIVYYNLKRLTMSITDEALSSISFLSKGLPHYAHLIGLQATREALDNMELNVTTTYVEKAIKKSITDAQHSIKTNYYKAVNSSKKDNIFSAVLLACALAKVNELGEFAAQDVRAPIHRITGNLYNIPAFAQHLNDFSDEKRGNILIKTGAKRRYRYKFADPLMQPYVIMQGMICGNIKSEHLFATY